MRSRVSFGALVCGQRPSASEEARPHWRSHTGEHFQRSDLGTFTERRQDFEISEGSLHCWLKIADRDDGIERGTATKPGLDESAELREARKRIKPLEQEAELMRRAVAYWSRDVNPE